MAASAQRDAQFWTREALVMARAGAGNFGRLELQRRRGNSRYRIDVRPAGYIYGIDGIGFGQNEELARGVLAIIRARVASGESAAAAVSPYLSRRSAHHRVTARYAEWLAVRTEECEAGDLSPNTLREYRRYARPGGEISFWETSSVHDVRTPDLRRWSSWLARRGLSPKTRQNVLGAFRTFFRYLGELEVVSRVPRFPLVRAQEHQPVIIDAATQGKILAAIPAAERSPFLMLAHLGLRPGEVRALRVRDIHAPGENGYAEVLVAAAEQGKGASRTSAPTKTRRARRLPLPPHLWEWLQNSGELRHSAGDILFFNPRTKKPWSHWALREAWLRGCALAGFGGGVGLYEGTKHSLASTLLEETGDIELVRQALGHSDIRSTQKYARLRPGTLATIARLPQR